MFTPKEIQLNFENVMLGISNFNWEVAGCRFFVGNSFCHPINNGPGREIHIETRLQLDGSTEWVVKMDKWVLGKDGKYHWEFQPSDRSKEFIEATRFSSKGSALLELIKFERRYQGQDQTEHLLIPNTESCTKQKVL